MADSPTRLDPSQSRGSSALATRYPDPNSAPLVNGVGPEQLVTDYLTALRCHAERVLRHKIPESALDSTPVEFVVTVPAVWSDRAQASTRRCAELAGMGTGSNLHIITEPEAAAMYALDAMDPHNIKIGDTFVLCDAGGGTVDLISYKVSALKPTLHIAEAAPGSGSLCGSTILNRIFHSFLQAKLGKDPNWDEDVVEEAMKRFEVTVGPEQRLESRCRSLIHAFRSNAPSTATQMTNIRFLVMSLLSISVCDFKLIREPIVPGLKDNVRHNVRRGRLRLTGADVSTIFEPVIREVIKLVNDQIDATKARVKAVLMVGGFGQNVYLRDCIRQTLANRNIEVMQSPNGFVKAKFMLRRLSLTTS
ncbi:MAG: hypothetical protein Q9197_001396 [Variospora fuerteventurae]